MKKITLFRLKSISTGLFFTFFLVSFLISGKVSAQNFCNNEIVFWSEDFGTGTNASSNSNIITGALTYQATGSLAAEGTYRVINSTHQKPEWHDAPDHTPGDVNGKMLVVNGQSETFYRKSVLRNAGYAAGFYSVSLFLMNVNTPGTCAPDPLLPTITINAEYRDANGNWIQLQNSPVTAPPVPQTSTPTWVHIGEVFVLPVTGSFIVKRIRFTLNDGTTGGCGNDFAIDDLKLASCPEGGPLPVQFLNVNAQKKGSGALISWSTSTEINNDYFEVEKSNDGGYNWYTVARTPGSVNSNVTKNYSAYDAKPSAGANYYRIKQVDKDGNSKFSATVVYKLVIANTDISVLANPFSNNITVDFLSDRNQTVSSRLFDNTGRQVISQKITVAKGSSRKSIETSNLNRGMYILQVIDENGQILYSDKLIKQ